MRNDSPGDPVALAVTLFGREKDTKLGLQQSFLFLLLLIKKKKNTIYEDIQLNIKNNALNTHVLHHSLRSQLIIIQSFLYYPWILHIKF